MIKLLNKRVWFVLLGIAITPFLFAQKQTVDSEWTLQMCVDHALENNLSVERSLLNMQSSDITLDQSKMARLPTINANGSTGFNWGRSIDPTTNDFITQRIHSIGTSGSANVTLFNGFSMRNTIVQNELAYEASKNDLEKVKNDIIQNVILFYVNVVFNQELYKYAKLQLSSTQEQVTRTQKQKDAGAVASSALLDIQAQMAANEVNVINQENALNLSKLQLKQLLQIPANQPFDVIVPEINMDENLAISVSVDEIYELSLNTMPEINSSKLNVESAEYGIRSARGWLYPRITASVGLSTNYSDAFKLFVRDGTFTQVQFADPEDPTGNTMVDAFEQVKFSDVHGTNFYTPVVTSNGSFETKPFSDQFSDNLSRFASVGISIPIFNGLQSRANVQRAMITKRQAEITELETKNTLRQTIESAHNDVLAAAKSYQSSLKLVEAREEAFRAVQKRNSLNAISKYDYQIAENDLFQAKSDLVRAKYDYIFKLKILDFYQGKTIDF